MKITLILIGILIIIAGAWMLFGTPDGEDASTIPEQGTVQDEAEADSSTAVENDDANVSAGTDIGMELPIPDPNTKFFEIEARNFSYNINEIRVQEGDRVIIDITSTDGFHDMVIDGLDVASTRVQTGETTSVAFVADKAGTYEFYCSVGNHRQQGMVGRLIVE